MSFVDDYLATVSPEQRAALGHIRKVVHGIVPDIEETKSYGMAAFRYKGKYVLAFNVFKDHMSIFPGGVVQDYKDQLKGFTITKGSVHFTVDKPVPDDALRDFVRDRVSLIDGR